MIEWLGYFGWFAAIATWVGVAIASILGPLFADRHYWAIPFGIVWLLAGYATELYLLKHSIW